jgi:hypothetical protein
MSGRSTKLRCAMSTSSGVKVMVVSARCLPLGIGASRESGAETWMLGRRGAGGADAMSLRIDFA